MIRNFKAFPGFLVHGLPLQGGVSSGAKRTHLLMERSEHSDRREVVEMKYIIFANIGLLVSILAVLGKSVWIA